ncbi:hypothetical protein F4808DRAFT_476019 [Astrocystis sublimbata]|nr:hypothetical protein F4808DRAFT_476019 [Astrocystis sublimbata]
MEYYGVAATEEKQNQPTRTVQLERKGTQCSASPTPSCDTSKNQAENELGENLLETLNAQSTTPVPTDWRQICYRGSSGSCCTGWNTQVDNLQQGDLAANLETLSQSCSSNGISGKIYGTKLYNTCVNQCANSGHKCS